MWQNYKSYNLFQNKILNMLKIVTETEVKWTFYKNRCQWLIKKRSFSN